MTRTMPIHRATLRARLIAVPLALAAAGCDAGFDRAVTVSDSAGVSIVPMPDGSLLAIQPPTGRLPRRDEWTESARFIRISQDGEAQRVLTLPAVRFTRLPGSVEPVADGPVLAFAFTHDGVVAGFPDRYDIGEYGPDGVARRRIRRDWEPVAVTAEQENRLRDRLTALTDQAGLHGDSLLREQPESQIRELAVADRLPAHGRLLPDRTGRLWVERVPPLPVLLSGPFPVRPEPTPWDVFDADGVWLGTVATPADTHVMDIDDEAVAGILRTGETDRVVVHRIENDPGQD